MNGLLLINLGTPEAPSTPAVRRYLREFLSDPRVIDIHPIGRAALLHLIILPLRPRKSAAAYRQIWNERGSPLLYYSQDLVERVRERMGPGWVVDLAMRYGEPSITSVLERWRQKDIAQGIDRMVVFPLYPQYSSASTGTAVEEVFRVAGRLWVTPNLSLVEPFYADPAFLDAFAVQGAPFVQSEQASERPDHVLFSFHGLPERHMIKADRSGTHCLRSEHCCDAIGPANRDCYRAQCFVTARGLATRLGLADDRWSVSFQSRLGRTPWIRPYTDVVVPELAKRGVRRLLVYCPAFVADCLETLEEIGIRGRQLFLDAGGESLTLVPSLNASPAWADAVVTLVRRQAERYGGA